MTERKCAWCGADISHKSERAKFCGPKCKSLSRRTRQAADWYLSSQQCKACGKTFLKQWPQQVLCDRNCAVANRQRSRKWYKNSDDPRKWHRENREAVNQHSRKWRLRNLEDQRARERAVKRRRAAEQALSLLILPIEEPKQ